MPNARSDSILMRKKPFKVLISLVTLVAFSFNTVSYDLALLRPFGLVGQAWAAGEELELSGVSSNNSGSPEVIKELNVNTFVLPEYLGQVKDSWSPSVTLRRGQPLGNNLAQGEYESLPPVVIHIQDAHCNYAAQHKISEIIEYVNREYGVDTVNLEGGAKDYDLSIFTNIPEKPIRQKVADYFVKEGLVNGAEYFAINNPEKVNLWGIEDTKLYIDNLDIYRNSLKHKDEVDKQLRALSYIMTNLKIRIYPKELLDLDTKYSQYKAGNLDFKDYLEYLIKTAKDKAIDIKSFTNIYLLNQTLGEEGGIDFRKANNQRDELIDRLQKKVSRKSLEELVAKTVEFKAEKISQKDFYSYLTDRANRSGIELKYYPDLQKYIVYLSMYNAIDKMKVMEEMDRLEMRIKESMYQNNKERELNTLSKNFAILKNIFNISLTREDYKYYQANRKSFDTSEYTAFISKEEGSSGAFSHQLSAFSNGDLDRYRDDISKFYEYSFKRDDAFVRNMRFSVKGQSRPRSDNRSGTVPTNHDSRTTNDRPMASVLITGGFHTDNLCEMFRKEGIAYVSIMPVFNNREGYQSPYFGLLKGELGNLGNSIYTAIYGSTSSLAAAALWTLLGKDVWGKNNELKTKLWIEFVTMCAEKGWNVDGADVGNFKNEEGKLLFTINGSQDPGTFVNTSELIERTNKAAEMPATEAADMALGRALPGGPGERVSGEMLTEVDLRSIQRMFDVETYKRQAAPIEVKIASGLSTLGPNKDFTLTSGAVRIIEIKPEFAKYILSYGNNDIVIQPIGQPSSIITSLSRLAINYEIDRYLRESPVSSESVAQAILNMASYVWYEYQQMEGMGGDVVKGEDIGDIIKMESNDGLRSAITRLIGDSRARMDSFVTIVQAMDECSQDGKTLRIENEIKTAEQLAQGFSVMTDIDPVTLERNIVMRWSDELHPSPDRVPVRQVIPDLVEPANENLYVITEKSVHALNTILKKYSGSRLEIALRNILPKILDQIGKRNIAIRNELPTNNPPCSISDDNKILIRRTFFEANKSNPISIAIALATSYVMDKDLINMMRELEFFENLQSNYMHTSEVTHRPPRTRLIEDSVRAVMNGQEISIAYLKIQALKEINTHAESWGLDHRFGSLFIREFGDVLEERIKEELKNMLKNVLIGGTNLAGCVNAEVYHDGQAAFDILFKFTVNDKVKEELRRLSSGEAAICEILNKTVNNMLGDFATNRSLFINHVLDTVKAKLLDTEMEAFIRRSVITSIINGIFELKNVDELNNYIEKQMRLFPEVENTIDKVELNIFKEKLSQILFVDDSPGEDKRRYKDRDEFEEAVIRNEAIGGIDLSSFKKEYIDTISGWLTYDVITEMIDAYIGVRASNGRYMRGKINFNFYGGLSQRSGAVRKEMDAIETVDEILRQGYQTAKYAQLSSSREAINTVLESGKDIDKDARLMEFGDKYASTVMLNEDNTNEEINAWMKKSIFLNAEFSNFYMTVKDLYGNDSRFDDNSLSSSFERYGDALKVFISNGYASAKSEINNMKNDILEHIFLRESDMTTRNDLILEGALYPAMRKYIIENQPLQSLKATFTIGGDECGYLLWNAARKQLAAVMGDINNQGLITRTWGMRIGSKVKYETLRILAESNKATECSERSRKFFEDMGERSMEISHAEKAALESKLIAMDMRDQVSACLRNENGKWFLFRIPDIIVEYDGRAFRARPNTSLGEIHLDFENIDHAMGRNGSNNWRYSNIGEVLNRADTAASVAKETGKEYQANKAKGSSEAYPMIDLPQEYVYKDIGEAKTESLRRLKPEELSTFWTDMFRFMFSNENMSNYLRALDKTETLAVRASTQPVMAGMGPGPAAADMALSSTTIGTVVAQQIEPLLGEKQEPVDLLRKLGAILKDNLPVEEKAGDQARYIQELLAQVDNSTLKEEKKATAQLGINAVLGREAISEIDPDVYDVVTQIVPLDAQRTLNNETRLAERKLERKYGISSKSIEVVCESSGQLCGDLEEMVGDIRRAMTDAKTQGKNNAMGLIYVPKRYFNKKVKDELNRLIKPNDNIKVQLTEEAEGVYPDGMTLFETGLKLLDYARNKDKSDYSTTSLLNLLSAVFDLKEDPKEILRKLFSLNDKDALKLRKIDLKTIQQFAEALQLVRQAL